MTCTFQKKVIKQILESWAEDQCNAYLINLYGERGIGKTKIAFSLMEELSNDWAPFYILGKGSNHPAYSTWSMLNQVKFSKINITMSAEVNLPILPINIRISDDSKNKNTPFDENELRILKGIIKKSKKKKILIIVDSFENWDFASKETITRLLISKGKVEKCQFYILIISENKLVNLENLKYLKHIEVPTPSNEDYKIIIQSKYPQVTSDEYIEYIKKMINNNFHLAPIVAQYIEEKNKKKSPHTSNLTEILEYKLNNLKEQRKLDSTYLEELSIIEDMFSKKETSYLLDCTQFEGEKILAIAKDNMFIDGEDKQFYFSDADIKKYFKDKLEIKEKYVHIKFVKYLEEYYPENYYQRFYHAKKGIDVEGVNGILKGLQLLLIGYARNQSKMKHAIDVNNYHLLQEYDNCLKLLPLHMQSSCANLKKYFINAFLHYRKYEYDDVIKELSLITPIYLCFAFKMEILRMELVCYIQKAHHKEKMLELANSLFNMIVEAEVMEDEQICQSCLILLDVYLDKHEDKQRAEIVKERFFTLINKHLENIEYINMYHNYIRRCSLYYPPEIALKLIDSTILYYKENDLYIDYYMALCNKAANLIIYNELEKAQNILQEATKIIKEQKYLYFPSQYKLHNNQYLIDYFMIEQKYYNHFDNIEIKCECLKQIEEVYKKFVELRENKDDEVSYVVDINMLSLSLILSKEDFWDNYQELEKKLHNTDAFYRFYLLNLIFAYSMINQEYSKAKDALEEIQTLEVPLLDPFKPIIEKRIELQKEMVKENFNGTIEDYNKFFQDNMKKIQDNSYSFYLRGLLFSDLQFLSF